jgi:hypothetical protein
VKSELKDLVTMVRKRYKQTLGLEGRRSPFACYTKISYFLFPLDDGKKLPFMYIDIKTGFGDYDGMFLVLRQEILTIPDLLVNSQH